MKTENLMRKLHVLLLFAGLLSTQLVTSRAAPGDPDETFGPGGYAQFSTSHLYSWLYTTPSILGQVARSTMLALQTDGKILVAAATDAPVPRLVLRRYNLNGTADLSFGLSGEAVATIGLPVEFVYGVPRDIKVQSDGKIVVAGLTFSDGQKRFRVWRFSPGGMLDTGFGNSGIVTRFSSADIEALSLGLLQGNILVAASNDTVSCISSSGGSCASFGLLSFISVPASTIAVIPRSGRFLTAKYSSQGVRQYFANGQIDTAFGEGGVAPICVLGHEVTGIQVQQNGKIVVGVNGFYYKPGFFTYSIGRLDPSGTIDQTFGSNGCLYSGDPVVPGFYGKLQSFRVQTDGKILALEGDSQYLNAIVNPSYSLIRYESNGLPDTTFNGVSTLPRNQDIMIQPGDGKIVTAGNDVLYVQNAWRYRHFYLARYLP